MTEQQTSYSNIDGSETSRKSIEVNAQLLEALKSMEAEHGHFNTEACRLAREALAAAEKAGV